MSNLTLQELVILVIAIVVICSVLIALVKGSLKVLIVGLLILTLFSGFTWLPEQIQKWLDNGTTTVEPIDPDMTLSVEETIKGIGDTAIDLVNQNKDSWIKAANTLWLKLTGNYEESETSGGESQESTESNQ